MQVDEKTVRGIRVRTKNSAEMNPEKAKIAGLWQRFYADIAPTLSQQASVLGVYCNYASDLAGEYDVLAGSDMLKDEHAAESVAIKGGRYLVFEGKGGLPEIVIETWSKVWDYFSSDQSDYTRAYTTDFELYNGDNEIQIFIAIE
ncbi:effector binding domain-containing protein [Amphritea sp. 1_MG-2023]|uniref:GyrI-like domain-containing protein n=1 Tax=Amphritea sp. 1_MG-2023 TaxID=3062670 RepID=UPI0026E1A477|nr:effector binding domain-containing protein [Amphritea sp. 1_MG-2023]MDO6563511.1 effector binding domain-containing protein [Amphritea sp. 1_MG-2023]